MRSKFILFLVVATAIMAIGVYLALTFLIGDGTGDDDLVDGEPALTGDGQPLIGVPLTLDNTTVYINPAPGNALMLQQQEPAEPVAPEAQPTLPPEQFLPTVTPAPEVVQPEPAQPVAPLVTTGQGIVAGVEPIIFVDYIVTSDDTLYRITEKQVTSIELMAVHGIDAQDLVPGANLRLPVGNPAYCAGSRPYVIRPGDTAYSIAVRQGTTAQTLQQLNNLGADFRIDIADVLCIP
ncbi:MAG: LysM peptidoglycan-binding domain-containing protein [Anaerolineae bacterium]|nr:LysM peptidoglycan-binding domain-containing protein [Anaerolineae bacterium]